MKVLWFTNDAVGLKENSFAGGWMESLKSQLLLVDNIELSIVTRAKLTNNKEINPTVELIKENVRYYVLPDLRSNLKKRVDLFFNREDHDSNVSRYLDIIKEVKPDVIHIFGSEMDYGLICKYTNIPVVLHLQGILTVCSYQLNKIKIPFSDRVRAYRFIDVVKGNTLKNLYKTFIRRTKIEQEIFSYCRNYIGRTKWDKNIIGLLSPDSEYFRGEELLRKEFFDANWNPSRSENKKLKIVSTISNPIYKGHDSVVSTCRILSEMGVNYSWDVIGINDSCSSYGLFYRDVIERYKLNINLLGSLNPKEIITTLEKSDMYVHPSHIENSSNAICEAMAVGIPVVAFEVGGNSSMIDNNVDGVLLPDNDPYLLASNLISLKKDCAKLLELSSNSKLRAKQRHDPKSVVDELIRTYEKVIELNE